jgi:hypothetical protein
MLRYCQEINHDYSIVASRADTDTDLVNQGAHHCHWLCWREVISVADGFIAFYKDT